MSERDDNRDGCLAVILYIASVVLIIYVAHSELSIRDHWIRDLQRRVGQLESAAK